jgi:hypothetical protein
MPIESCTVQIGDSKAKTRKAIADLCARVGCGRGYRKEVRGAPTHVDQWGGDLVSLDDLAEGIRHDTDPDPRYTGPMRTGEWTVYLYACTSIRWQDWQLVSTVHVVVEPAS